MPQFIQSITNPVLNWLMVTTTLHPYKLYLLFATSRQEIGFTSHLWQFLQLGQINLDNLEIMYLFPGYHFAKIIFESLILNFLTPWLLFSISQFSCAGKTPQLYRHDLPALHSKQSLHRFSLHMNKIPERLMPRKFALTTRVPDTKGCTKCCVGRNPYNGYKYLCGAVPSGIFLMQWYDPLNKFMLLKVRPVPYTSSLLFKNLFVSPTLVSMKICIN